MVRVEGREGRGPWRRTADGSPRTSRGRRGPHSRGTQLPNRMSHAAFPDWPLMPPRRIRRRSSAILRRPQDRAGNVWAAGVNLRAGGKRTGTELSDRLKTIITEREDIHRRDQETACRHPEAQQGRPRPPCSLPFGHLNASSQRLFTSPLWRAPRNCRLIESNDPLEAGLEILAPSARQETAEP